MSLQDTQVKVLQKTKKSISDFRAKKKMAPLVHTHDHTKPKMAEDFVVVEWDCAMCNQICSKEDPISTHVLKIRNIKSIFFSIQDNIS